MGAHLRKKVTMADIAEGLGVSKNAVSLALSGKNGVSQELRRRVIDKAVEMEYMAAPPDTQSKCIAVLVPEYLHDDMFFYSELLWAIGKEAEALGCSALHVGVTEAAPPALPKELRVVGLLVIGVVSQGYIQTLRGIGLPLLSVDIAYPGVPCVGASNVIGGALAVEYLLENGHRRIGFIGPVDTALSVYERWCGYTLALRRAGLESRPEDLILGERHTFRLLDTPETLGPYLAGRDTYPTAWFCAGDRIAIALIHVLNDLGLKVPEDISVMGFDDIAAAQMVLPRLSTVRVDRKQMGRLAVERLLAPQGEEVVSHSVSGTLVVRDSVKTI
jgi:LacI family transcriptional regulator/LacI family purine nucleotide synthesis repressor